MSADFHLHHIHQQLTSASPSPITTTTAAAAATAQVATAAAPVIASSPPTQTDSELLDASKANYGQEIRLRHLTPDDIDELKILCSKWFPIE